MIRLFNMPLRIGLTVLVAVGLWCASALRPTTANTYASDNSNVTGQNQSEAPLTGTVWELKTFRDRSGSLVAPTENFAQGILAQFDGRQMRGNLGCNFYEAKYLAHGTRLSLSRPSQTLVACGSLNDEEEAYREALMRVAQYAIERGSLQLRDGDGTLLAEFAAFSPDPLVGTPWTISWYEYPGGGLGGSSLDRRLTAVFQPDGRLAGEANCNEYTASYTVAQTRLTIGDVATTRRYCAEPEGAMEREASYLAALREVSSFEIRGRQLSLKAADGGTVVLLLPASASSGGGSPFAPPRGIPLEPAR